MIFYIAGPMTGLPGYNKDAFTEAARLLRACGHTVLNPATLPVLPEDKYLPICTAMIDAADAIYLLDGWPKSLGARCERLYAKRQGKLELTEKDIKIRIKQEKRKEESNGNEQ